MPRKFLSFGIYDTRKGAKTAARNYGIRSPLIRKRAKKDSKGRTYMFDFKLFERDV